MLSKNVLDKVTRSFSLLSIYLVFSALAACGSSNTPTAPTVSFESLPVASVSLVPPTVGTSSGAGSAPRYEASYKVDATSQTPVSYQWYRNNVSIAGATEAQYTTTPLDYPEPPFVSPVISSLSVIVSNATGSVKLDATIGGTVVPYFYADIAGNERGYIPVIPSQPGGPNTGVGLNQTTTLSVTAISTLPISYQWYKNDVSIAGATNAQYTTLPASLTDAEIVSYSVVVSTTQGSVISRGFAISIANQFPKITQQPSDRFAFPGKEAYFSVSSNIISTGSVEVFSFSGIEMVLLFRTKLALVTSFVAPA